MRNDANVQQNNLSHSTCYEFQSQNQNASLNKQAGAQIADISFEHNYVDTEFQDENAPVHVTESKCYKKGTSCRKRHLTQNACASNVSTTGKNQNIKKDFKNFAVNMALKMKSMQK